MADSVLQASMAETESKDELSLPSKRKLDSLPLSQGKEEERDLPNKTQKPKSFTHNNGTSPSNDTEKLPLEPPSVNSSWKSSVPEENNVSKAQAEENDVAEDKKEEEEDEEEDFDDVDYEDNDDEEEENGEAVAVDRKGKGIMIEENEGKSDDDDDDDSSDGGSDMEGDDSELEDDPLAEVDLDNILPSRTRRRSVQPGVYIANDLDNSEHDDSDDSDA